MPDRYFCDDLQPATVELTDSEAHHAQHVMRLKVGDTVSLFDGQGTIADGTVSHFTRRAVRVELVDRQTVPEPNVGQVTIAAAVPKGDRVKWMVEKLTELGVHRWVPLNCHRSVTAPGPGRLQKLQATVISACKQSGRVHLMQIDVAQSLSESIRETHERDDELWIADLSPDAATSWQPANQTEPAGRTILIGPEGGFTQEEVDEAVTSGARRTFIAGHVLRTETAAVAFAAIAAASR